MKGLFENGVARGKTGEPFVQEVGEALRGSALGRKIAPEPGRKPAVNHVCPDRADGRQNPRNLILFNRSRALVAAWRRFGGSRRAPIGHGDLNLCSRFERRNIQRPSRVMTLEEGRTRDHGKNRLKQARVNPR